MNENGDSFADKWGPYRSGYLKRPYSLGGETFEVALALPAGEPRALLVALDGALHFEAIANAAAVLARREEKTGIGPTIVAGIATGHGWSHDAERREQMFVPGEALHPALRELIIARLLPDLAGAFPIEAARRGIFGHSFGALFALDLALVAPGTFGAVIAASPSLWRRPELVASAFDNAGDWRVLFALGGSEPEKMVDPLSTLVRRLEARRQELKSIVLENEDHGSVPFALIPRALRFLHGSPRCSG